MISTVSRLLHGPLRPWVLTACALISYILFHILTPANTDRSADVKQKGFHVLIPTTSTNTQVCKLLGSGAINGYPDPMLVGWEGRGRYNGTTSHLFKLTEGLAYINNLRKDQDDDLILMLDAFDVWLQLPPSVIINRYHQALAKSNARLHAQGVLGDRSSPADVPVRNSILFGADKWCWPRHGTKPPCWTVPDSIMPADAFGPLTDKGDEWTIRPRFLNSGSIMGTASDIRALFKATIAQIDVEWDDENIKKNSDQYYFGFVWAEQEQARTKLVQARRAERQGKKLAAPPAANKRVEFGLTVDYESDAFTINNWYAQYMTWMTHNRSVYAPELGNALAGRLDTFAIPDDLASARGPFAILEDADSDLAARSWADVMLGTSAITGRIFPLYHVTGDKSISDRWWPRMWFHPHGEALLSAARRDRLARTDKDGAYVVAEVDGVQYVAGQAGKVDRVEALRARDRNNAKGGAWNDQGQYMYWSEICAAHERGLWVS